MQKTNILQTKSDGPLLVEETDLMRRLVREWWSCSSVPESDGVLPAIVLPLLQHQHKQISCLIGGTINIGEGDIYATGNPDCFITVVREAKEELSLDLHDNNIVFFGLGRNISNLKPELYGEILISGITEKEIVQSWKNAKDKEESMNLIIEDINGSRLRTMIKQNNRWSPVGRRATIASLSNRSVVQPVSLSFNNNIQYIDLVT